MLQDVHISFTFGTSMMCCRWTTRNS